MSDLDQCEDDVSRKRLSKARRLLRRLLLGLSSLVALLLVALTVAVLLELSVGLTPWKGALESQLSDLLGRSVTLEKLALRLSPWPTVTIHALRITDSQGDSELDLEACVCPGCWSPEAG